MTRDRFDALVAAGGFATRLATTRPKSLLKFGAKYFLRATVEELGYGGCSNILVVSNRKEWGADIIDAVDNIPDVSLLHDEGFRSTFLLARHLAEMMQDRFIFAYGHAPRRREHIQALWQSKAKLAASVFPSSSKMKLIQWRSGSYLEPPYCVDRDAVMRSERTEWAEFFSDNSSSVDVISPDGPPEFNLPNELLAYEEYAIGAFSDSKVAPV